MNVKDRPSSPGSAERPTVWVVDDSPLETEMARRLLIDRYDVEVFSDGPPLLERIASGVRPDLLVLDWHMPEMSGLEVCRFLRQAHDEASLPILVLTATGGHDDLLEGLAAGANDFYTKAFDPAEFLARVGTLVRAKFLHDSLKRTELATRRARETAEEANRAKDVFLATVSHELRTPLNSILGWARLLGESSLDEETLRRGIATIQRNAQIQVQLIEDILDITRVISGKLHLELASLDFGAIVRSAFDAVKPAADAKQLAIDLVIEESALRMRGDFDRLQQAVGNLLTNAVKFTPAGGKIRIDLRAAPGELRLRISDSGKGIAPQFLPHVFDRFRQEDDAATRRHSGLGLGLALVRHIVAAHGGSVSAESEGEGRGSTFTLVVPRADLPRSQVGESDRPSPPPSNVVHNLPVGRLAQLQVLVVEDDEDARDLLVTVLAKQGAKVEEAGSVAEALVRLSSTVPDVLLSDIGLPIDDGYELIRAVRALGLSPERLPAIALTAYARREDRRLALQAGFQAHVAKPVEPAELINVVADAARAARASRGA
ncbi:MAG TPA: response regulator [Polyangiaceae bacterium]|jgi:signal transduction histidine kinase|nr:response regulator [Polyangiaceae bacterium]